MRKTTISLTMVLGLTLAGCTTNDGPARVTEATSPTATQEAETGADADAEDDEATDTEADMDASTAGGQDGAAGGEMSDEICAGFFQNPGNTLADRSDAARDALEAGEVSDPASWGEVNLLSQRIRDLAENADGEHKDLLERINEPFLETSAVVHDDPEVSASDDEIDVPEIDVTDSAAAQEEFATACEG
ncbi:MAG: hypothetical protein Q4G34_11980 [Micrococcus sp.]|nr:hypothetical protein [Micrococcus sp.]